MTQEDYKYLRDAIAMLEGVESNVTGWEYGLIGGAVEQLKGVVEEVNEDYPEWREQYDKTYNITDKQL